MKKLFLLASSLAFVFITSAQQKADEVIKINMGKHDFGKIKQGVPVITYFVITNISNKPVVIESAVAGCGCTTPEVSKAPIAPNSTTKVKVGFNAASLGRFDKDVTIKLAGIQEPKIVMISGNVLDANAFSAYAKTSEYKKSQKDKSIKDSKKAGKKSKVAVTSTK